MNIFENIIFDKENEIFDTLHEKDGLRIERITSNGQASSPNFWYDQEENEWVAVLEGEAELEYKDGEKVHLSKGDYVYIPKHKLHRVNYTSDTETTIWLAIFFK